MRATTFGWQAMLVATEQHVFNREDKHRPCLHSDTPDLSHPVAFECPGPVSHFSLSSPRSRQIQSPLSPHLQSRLSYPRQHRPGLASPARPGHRAPLLTTNLKTFGLLCLANIQVTWYTFDKAIGQNCCSLERRLFMKNSVNTTLYIPETLDLKLESSWDLLAT